MNTASTSFLDLTQDLAGLAHLAFGQERELEDLVRASLEGLARVVPYDLATLFWIDGLRLVVGATRGPLSGRNLKRYWVMLDTYPYVRESLESRRAVRVTKADHEEVGDPFDAVMSFPPGHGCLVVPLCVGDHRLGVVTLDRREEEYTEESVVRAEAYGRLLAAALHALQTRSAVERLHRQDHEHAKLLEAALVGDPERLLAAGRSEAMAEVVRRAKNLASATAPVHLVGEPGTELLRLARLVHQASPRADLPFVVLPCAALVPEKQVRALAGQGDESGRLLLANGGTLVLDGVEALWPDAQILLERLLVHGTFFPVDHGRELKVDLRVFSTGRGGLLTNPGFSSTLAERLSLLTLRVPPLRERLEDLPALAEVLLSELALRAGRQGLRLGAPALARLTAWRWPGNVEELSSVLERAALLTPGEEIGPEALSLPSAEAEGPPAILDEVQRAHIQRVLALTGGRIFGENGAARILGLKPTTLQSRMKKLGLRRR